MNRLALLVKTIAAALSVCLLLSGCTIYLKPKDLDPALAKRIADSVSLDAEAINEVQKGQILSVELGENRTTPVQWRYTISDESKVAFVHEDYITKPNPGGANGVGGTLWLFFEALEPGECTITLALARVEKDEKAQVMKEYTVSVQADSSAAATSEPTQPTPAPVQIAPAATDMGNTQAPVVCRDGCEITLTQRAVIGEGLPEFNFLVTGLVYGGEYTAGELVVEDAEGPVWACDLYAYSFSEDFGFRLEDVNFDGFLDVTIDRYRADEFGNRNRSAYLFDPKTREYTKLEAFEKILNPAVDPARKQLRSVELRFPLCVICSIGSLENLAAGVPDRQLRVDISLDEETGLPCYHFTEYRDGTYGSVAADILLPPGTDPRAAPESTGYFEPGSEWDLDNSFWFSGEATPTMGVPELARLLGTWHALSFVPAGYDDRFRFDASGEYGFGASEMGDAKIRYKGGKWSVRGDTLYLETLHYLVEGAEKDRLVTLLMPEPETISIGKFGTDLDTGKDTLVIGGVTYYRFENQDDMTRPYFDAIKASER